jgi:hypothetical protein
MKKKKEIEEVLPEAVASKILFTKDNILLVEFHTGEPVREVYDAPDNTKQIAVGEKLYAVYDGYSNRLAFYDQPSDTINLECLIGKEDYYLVAVSATPFNTFKWVCMQLGKPYELGGHQVFSIKGKRDCLPEEVKFLNETYPAYLENAF